MHIGIPITTSSTTATFSPVREHVTDINMSIISCIIVRDYWKCVLPDVDPDADADGVASMRGSHPMQAGTSS